MYGNTLVGNIDPLSLAGAEDDGPRVLALGGRSWRVDSIDYGHGRVYVTPSEQRGVSRWIGVERGESRKIARTVRDVLADATIELGTALTRRAQCELEILRDEMEGTLCPWPIEQGTKGYVWWTYGGLAANRLLAGRVLAAGGHHAGSTSLNVTFSIGRGELELMGGWKGLENLEPKWTPDVVPKFATLLPAQIVHVMTLMRAEAKATS